MDAKRKDELRLAEEAASWLIRLEEDDSLRCRTEFVAWTKASPRHVEEMLFAHAIWSELAHIDPSRQIDLQSLPIANEESVVALDPTAEAPKAHSPTREERPRAVRHWVAIAACAAIAAIAWGWLTSTGSRSESQLYITSRGNQTKIDMSDGSVMYLNTDSRARVQFSDSTRQVRLLSGEALFMVKSVHARPFRVITDDATIKAVGTQFNVYQHTAATRVTVVDGVVEIEADSVEMSPEGGNRSVQLSAGNEADVSAGQVIPVPTPDVQRAVAWRTQQLVFRGEPLEQVAAEFNRYNTVQIRLEGEDVRSLKIGGVFKAKNPQPLIEYLADVDPPLEITRSGDEILIRLRDGG